MPRSSTTCLALLLVAGCTGPPKQPQVGQAGPAATSSASLEQTGRVLKRKVAVARFSNETKYGRGVFGGGTDSPIEQQAADILKARLAETGKVVLVDAQGWTPEGEHAAQPPADYVILGSVSEFGRTTTSETGFMSRKLTQTAHAGVNLRLVRTSTGEVIYSEEGSGEASMEVGKTFGVGTEAGYDSTLNDKAISAAISRLTSNIVENLLDEPWRTAVLKLDAGQVVIAGGKLQGLRPGDELAVLVRGERVANPQYKTMIELPGKQVARIEVVSSFGSEVTTEGSVCKLIEGSLEGQPLEQLVVESEGKVAP